MANPIKAKDVIIQFLSGGGYVNYACAETLETTFTMETKPVKTIGDGVWKRPAGQSLGQTINLSGVVQRASSTPDAFDLLDNFKSMTAIDFKIIFFDEAGVAKILKGIGLPTEVSFSAGSEGFATGSITIEVIGDPDYVPVVPPEPPNPLDPDDCVAEIETAHSDRVMVGPTLRRFIYIDTMVSGSADIARWDYSIDGGGLQTAFTDGNIPTSWILPIAYNVGSHSITITPVCDNGFSGTPFTFSFSFP